MGKFLRVLSVFIFIFSIVALTFGILLFNKREILKGRTQKLETSLRKIAKTFEAETPLPPDPLPEFESRDISECTPDPEPDPLRSEFWDAYKHELELQAEEFVNLDPQDKQRQLMSYYRWNVITDKADRDPLTGEKITEGPGTMQGLLDEVLKKAQNQLDVLMATRAELIKTREELQDTVAELNRRKGVLREKLAEIVRLNAEIVRLNGIIDEKNREIEELKDMIRSLELRIQDLEQEKRKLQEDLDDLQIKNEKLTETVSELRGIIDKMKNVGTQDSAMTSADTYEGGGLYVKTIKLAIVPGVKGTVASVNEKQGFVVIKMNDTFMTELREQLQTQDQVPAVALIVRRGTDADAQFISKVRLIQIKEEELLGIGDIMVEWQQEPIKVGDTILYQ